MLQSTWVCVKNPFSSCLQDVGLSMNYGVYYAQIPAFNDHDFLYNRISEQWILERVA